MIITRLSGGLGNQMFQYVFGLAQARRKGTTLKMDLSAYQTGQEKRSLSLDAFKIKSPAATREDFKAIGVPSWDSNGFLSRARRKIFRMKEERKPLNERRAFLEPRFTYCSEVLEMGADAFFIGDWQSEKYFLDVANEVRAEFTVKELSSAGKRVRDDIVSKSGGTPVSLHVRRGDYVSDANAASKHGALPVEYYQAAWKLISEKAPNARVYIFSDDIEWCRENLSFIGNQVMVSGQGTNAAEDIILMSLCSHHIIANSSFSWWGAWLDPKTDKIVIVPKQWFKTTADTKDLIPSSWIRI